MTSNVLRSRDSVRRVTPSARSTAVRRALPTDVPAILGMVRDLAAYERAPDAVLATNEMLRDALFGPDPKVFAHVVEHVTDDGSASVGGFAVWFVNFSTWLGRHGIWLEDLYVRPEHRGRGYGQALLRELARTCLERGYGRLEWWVLDWNGPALGFYRSLGAEAMDEWTVQRVTGEALTRLAGTPSSKAGESTSSESASRSVAARTEVNSGPARVRGGTSTTLRAGFRPSKGIDA